MRSAPLPHDEKERLEALCACNVLDTGPEPDFDALTQLAAELIDVPIALVSLIDADRQWFKSRVGLDATESGRDVAFCSHAILRDEMMIVEDARQDERFHDNPFVTEPPHIRFYAGMPLRSRDGYKFGTLCVIDNKPRQMSEKHRRILKQLAMQAQAQLELRRHIGRLEQEARFREEAQAALLEARKNEENANRAKSTFLANMSHEIRTPLTSIIGFAEQLAKAEDPGLAEHAEWLRIISTNGKHLLSLINDVLDLSKIEAGEMTYESVPINAGKVIHDAIDMLQQRARDAGLALEVQLDPGLTECIHGDPTRLRQVLVNLIGNAVKFTPTGSIKVHARIERPRGATPVLRVDVTDTGVGMSAQQLDKLFSAFNQAESSTARSHGGTGLGLCISRAICRGMGGDLTAVSTPSQGSTFTARVAARPAEAISQPPNCLPDDVSGRCGDRQSRVLVIDDSEPNLKLFSLILKKHGYDVTTAPSGQNAIDFISAHGTDYFNVLLMDIQMPGIDGYEATRRLRSMGVRSPILALTAEATTEGRDAALRAGCNDRVTKPIEADALGQVVNRWLARHADAA